MEDDRPNPEQLLEAVKREEEKEKRGRLKVFLGMAAGVGKTYAMLEDAHQRLRVGVDVVVGIVNTHGRVETSRLLDGLEIIPPKEMVYKNSSFEELDLEAILRRRPELVLVDELAHTNIPGSLHLKRWQDVDEILDNGIDVATTVNVQHIESLKDIVETITGITIHETVPDCILEQATYFELVDLIPAALLQRLKEGKVYLGSQRQIALEHFFQEDRLTALREIALRFAAEKVTHDLQSMVSTTERAVEWKPRERLLVAVGPSPHSQKLIRTTRRLAFRLNAHWIACHVDDGNVLDEAAAESLDKNMQLARELGAEVVTTQDTDVASAIERIARQKQVTQIIVGRPPRLPFLGIFPRASLLDRLATECHDIDVHVIRQTLLSSRSKRKRKKLPEARQFQPYFFIFGLVVLLTGLNALIEPYVGYKVVGFIFLLGILLLSLFFNKGPVFFGSLLYGVIWDYYFIPPVGTFVITSQEDTVLLALYLLTACVTGVLADRIRKQKAMLARREESSQALYEIVSEIATSPTSQEILRSVKVRLDAILHGHCEFLIVHLNNGHELNVDIPFLPNEKEKAAALWVFENGKEAGLGTTTLPASQNLYVPLKGYKEVVGVLAYRPHGDQHLTTEEKNFLHTAVQQLSYYLERYLLEEKEREKQQFREIERIYQAIETSIAEGIHDPFSSIHKVIRQLLEENNELLEQQKISPRRVKKMEALSNKLVHTIENISAMGKQRGRHFPYNSQSESEGER